MRAEPGPGVVFRGREGKASPHLLKTPAPSQPIKKAYANRAPVAPATMMHDSQRKPASRVPARRLELNSFLEPFFSCRPQHPGCRRRLAIHCIGRPRRLHPPSGPDIRAAGTLLSPEPRLFLAPGARAVRKNKKKRERRGSEAPGGEERRRRDLETPTANNKEIENNTLIYHSNKKSRSER